MIDTTKLRESCDRSEQHSIVVSTIEDARLDCGVFVSPATLRALLDVADAARGLPILRAFPAARRALAALDGRTA